VVQGRGFASRLPPEIRAMADIQVQGVQWRYHKCMIDVDHDTFSDECVERGHRPLVFVWGDSTAGALMPGLIEAQKSHNFGIAQFTASSCVPILNVDSELKPKCRANNDRVLSLATKLQPDIVLLQGTWEKDFNQAAATVATLKQRTKARVVVLGAVPYWKHGLPNEVLRYWLLYHALIPVRSTAAQSGRDLDDKMRALMVPKGAEFISAREVLCDEEGCLTRLGDAASDITSSDTVHLTEKASVFLVQGIIDRVLGNAPASASQ
jgi:hypothetical protein